jgi:hypothetical protein
MIFRKVTEVPDGLVARIVGSTPNGQEAAMASMSYPVAVKLKSEVGSRGSTSEVSCFSFAHRALQSRGCLMILSWYAVKVWDQPNLLGQLGPFEKLADLRQAEKSQYVQSVLKRAREQTRF